jgi:hypothetical protein
LQQTNLQRKPRAVRFERKGFNVMKTVIVALMLAAATCSVYGNTFQMPHYDINKYCETTWNGYAPENAYFCAKGQQLSYDGIMRTEIWKAISPEKASLCAKTHEEYAGLAECFKASQPLEPFKY